ncbi:MAG: hypothetical protein Q9195_007963 [Heterodermia aff. obscurata]
MAGARKIGLGFAFLSLSLLTMKLRFCLCGLGFFPVPALSTINILMQLRPIRTSQIISPSVITQKCTSLPLAHCCAPIDISETSHTTDRQRYSLTALDFRSDAPDRISIWASNSAQVRNCEGPAAAILPLQPGKGWRKYAPKLGWRISGFAINDASRAGEEREVWFPSVVEYRAGLYYEYMEGKLVYAKVSLWGEGPNIIYGLRQEGGGVGGLGNGTVGGNGSLAAS